MAIFNNKQAMIAGEMINTFEQLSDYAMSNGLFVHWHHIKENHHSIVIKNKYDGDPLVTLAIVTVANNGDLFMFPTRVGNILRNNPKRLNWLVTL